MRFSNKLSVLFFLFASLFFQLCLPVSAHSQEKEKNYFDVFIGPSYGNIALGSETALFAPTSRNFYGLEFNVKMNLHKNVGIILLMQACCLAIPGIVVRF